MEEPTGQSCPSQEFRPRNTLEGLPAEILTQILEHLVPEPPELGETRPVNYEKLHPEEPWYERTRRRRGLRGCCLASTTMCSVARPLLYRNVFVIYEEDLIQLLRTLLEKPDLGTWTRFASVHLTLTDDGVCREIWRMAIPAFAALHSIAMQPSLLMMPPSYRGRKVPTTILLRMPQELLYLALRAMTRLDCLLLQIPITMDHQSPQYEYLCENFAEPPQDSLVPPRPPACSKITQLLLQADPDFLVQLEDDARQHGDDDLGIEGGSVGLYCKARRRRGTATPFPFPLSSSPLSSPLPHYSTSTYRQQLTSYTTKGPSSPRAPISTRSRSTSTTATGSARSPGRPRNLTRLSTASPRC